MRSVIYISNDTVNLPLLFERKSCNQYNWKKSCYSSKFYNFVDHKTFN